MKTTETLAPKEGYAAIRQSTEGAQKPTPFTWARYRAPSSCITALRRSADRSTDQVNAQARARGVFFFFLRGALQVLTAARTLLGKHITSMLCVNALADMCE